MAVTLDEATYTKRELMRFSATYLNVGRLGIAKFLELELGIRGLLELTQVPPWFIRTYKNIHGMGIRRFFAVYQYVHQMGIVEFFWNTPKCLPN
jgi:hypothetical protein